MVCDQGRARIRPSPSAPVIEERAPSLSQCRLRILHADLPDRREASWEQEFIERRFPIFTGYVFVNLPTEQFGPVESVEGVGKLLKYSRTYGEAPEPFSFPQEVIDRLRYMVWEDDQEYLLEKASRMRREEVDREMMEVKKATSRASRKIRMAALDSRSAATPIPLEFSTSGRF